MAKLSQKNTVKCVTHRNVKGLPDFLRHAHLKGTAKECRLWHVSAEHPLAPLFSAPVPLRVNHVCTVLLHLLFEANKLNYWHSFAFRVGPGRFILRVARAQFCHFILKF